MNEDELKALDKDCLGAHLCDCTEYQGLVEIQDRQIFIEIRSLTI